MSETMAQHSAEKNHPSSHRHKGSVAAQAAVEPTAAAGAVQADGVSGETTKSTMLQAEGGSPFASHDIIPPTHRTA
jgi:hypothetical protein